jgi:flagellar hook protein FlgE
MQVNNNINSMMQLEKRLEKSADELTKLGLDNEQLEENSNKEFSQNDLQESTTSKSDVNVSQELTKQVQIPLTYTANAGVISTQNSAQQSILDIKA